VKGWLPETITKLSRYLLHDQLAIAREDLLAAIILLQAPNLERLDDVGKYDRAGFKFLRRDAVIQDQALPPNLKHLCLGDPANALYANNMTMMDLSWNGYGAFIDSLEELESLTVYCPVASGVGEPLSFQSLRTLRLYEFHMPRKDFENLISRIPHLEKFG
jgi:hypothetical protein